MAGKVVKPFIKGRFEIHPIFGPERFWEVYISESCMGLFDRWHDAVAFFERAIGNR